MTNPDLKNPEDTLKRIAAELTVLQGASPDHGEYPSGYHNNVTRAINAVNAAKDYASGGYIDDDDYDYAYHS